MLTSILLTIITLMSPVAFEWEASLPLGSASEYLFIQQDTFGDTEMIATTTDTRVYNILPLERLPVRYYVVPKGVDSVAYHALRSPHSAFYLSGRLTPTLKIEGDEVCISWPDTGDTVIVYECHKLSALSPWQAFALAPPGTTKVWDNIEGLKQKFYQIEIK